MTTYTWLIVFAFLLSWQFLSLRNPFLLKNIFIVYTFAIYNIAPLVLSYDQTEDYNWSLEFLAVLMLFIIGYSLGLRFARQRRMITVSASPSWRSKDRVLKTVLLALVLANALFLLYKVVSFGVVEYYAGAFLVATIQAYGKYDSVGAFFQIVTFILGTLTTVFLVVFVERIVNQQDVAENSFDYNRKRQLALRLSFVWLVLFPVFQFSRSGAVFGVVTYLAIRSKIQKRSFSLVLVALTGLALLFFIYAGLSRSKALGISDRVETLFVSELTPWIAYRDIRANIEQLGYQYGNTIFLPFLLKVIPRGLYPDKPQNSGGYFMTVLYPDQFQSGFALPPTYMGALYLNFGVFGVITGIFLLGVFSGRVDGIVIYRQFHRIGFFLLVLPGYVSLLRDDPVTAWFNLSVGIILYFVVSTWVRFKIRLSG